jgi:hypothetical protein
MSAGTDAALGNDKDADGAGNAGGACDEAGARRRARVSRGDGGVAGGRFGARTTR